MKKPKQPDRWERIADNLELGITRFEVEDLLRREHRAVVQMVRRHLSTSSDWGYQEAIDDILAKLKARGQ